MPCAQRAHGADGRDVLSWRLCLHLPLLRDARNAERRDGAGGRPEAVLIRGVEGAEGPGRLTKLLKIDRSLNREDLVRSNRLWLESDGARVKFTSAPRIGIAYASKRVQNRTWRWTLCK